MRCKECGSIMEEVEGTVTVSLRPYGDRMVEEYLYGEPTWECTDCGCTAGCLEDDVYEELDGGAEMTEILCFLAAKNWEEAIRAIKHAKAEEDVERIRRGRNEH